jgi:hypothetical protein
VLWDLVRTLTPSNLGSNPGPQPGSRVSAKRMINEVSLMARKPKIQHHGSDNKPDMRNNAFPSGPPAEEEYKVGPGCDH